MLSSTSLQRKLFLVCFVSVIFGWVMTTLHEVAIAQIGKRRFTVADDIGLTHLDRMVMFAPNGRYFFVTSERGRLDENKPESSVRVYHTEEIHRFVAGRDVASEPSPLWTISKSTYGEGPIISEVRWLPDSSGFVFLEKNAFGNDQLFLSDIRTKSIRALTEEGEHVTAFDVRSITHFVYCVRSPAIKKEAREAKQASAMVGTGRSLRRLISPEDNVKFTDLSELWAVLDGKRFRVADPSSGRPLAIHAEGQSTLALSPDGHSVVTALTVNDVPEEWETLYPPPIPSFPDRVRAGKQNPDAFAGWMDVSEYVLVDLATGKIRSLANAPTGNTAGWVGPSLASWSLDGRSIVLSNTFLRADTQGNANRPNRPCVAVADLRAGRLTCVDRRKEQSETDDKESWRVFEVYFASETNRAVVVVYQNGLATTYAQSEDGFWIGGATGRQSVPHTPLIAVSVKQSLNGPPLLVATDLKTGSSRVIWDPNPQLKDIQLGPVSVFRWKDKSGHDWIGGLYKPPDYASGKRYPLVIQTHGFDEQEFRPSGAYPTAFAAQELAAVGFLVLQVEDCDIEGPEEGPCQVSGYEAAVQQLSADGLVDIDSVGIIGFSATCFYVLEALTTSRVHFKAAAITDGVNAGYVQYITGVDSGGDGMAYQDEAAIGTRPFGSGLHQWLKRSPEFNMDRVETPLQVVALGRLSLLLMWEPYAALRYLKRPTDLIVVTSAQHVLTNPAARMASQGGSVDWFLFWLKDEEIADPAKAEQYVRWRRMRALRDAGSKKVDQADTLLTTMPH